MSETFSAHNLDTALSGKGFVLVDFWAEWCGPCRMLSPIIDKVAEDYKGKVRVGKVDVESEQELAELYDVSSLPRLLLFKDGEIVWDRVGACHEKVLTDMLKVHLC